MKGVMFLVFGIVIGILSTVAVGWNVLPNMMLDVKPSELPFAATVTAVQVGAKENGWLVPKVYDLQKSLKKAGHEISRAKVISICQPDHAFKLLSDDDSKIVTAMMPFRIGIFEVEDGGVYVAKMNTGMMSKMFGGRIESVMGEVAVEEQAILRGIVGE